MNKSAIAVLVIMGLSLICSVPLSATARIEFEKTEIGIGIIDEGQKVDIAIPFTNTGDEPLVLKRITTSCGCVTQALEKREYQPGEKGSFTITFNSTGQWGRVNHRVVVFTNTPEQYVKLTLLGKVIRKNYAFASIPAEMRRVNFEETRVGEEYRREIILKNQGNRPLRIIETTHSPQVILEFTRMRLDPEESTLIVLRYRPMETGEFSSFLKIHTSALKGKHITVHVTADPREAGTPEALERQDDIFE